MKVFRSFDEKSWFRESQIYNQYLLPHDNVLGYMAADITSKSDKLPAPFYYADVILSRDK